MTILDAVLRLGIAIVVGGAIGLNRDLKGKPAGVRTHALVALGSALVTGLLKDSSPHPDAVSRVIQGVITGIGFLGAGVILRPEGGRTVRGLTTAASIWVVAALGIACGLGQWIPVATGTLLTLGVLLFGRTFEKTAHRITRRSDTPEQHQSGGSSHPGNAASRPG